MQYIVLNLGGLAELHLRGVQEILDRKDTVKQVYTDQGVADRAAQEKAAAQPGTQYAVMGLTMIHAFETTKPKVITKVLNDRGELVLEGSEAKAKAAGAPA